MKEKESSLDDLIRKNINTIASMEKAFNERRSTGERVADGVAALIGSWPFLIIQTMFLLFWMVLNLIAWSRHWDPYPFILLNLALSFQAAYASPIILMSQNRQARLDERRNQLDLQVNMLAEQETTEILRLLIRICERLGIDGEEGVRALENKTEPERLAEQIEKIEKKNQELDK